jgi:hypothetical protein
VSSSKIKDCLTHTIGQETVLTDPPSTSWNCSYIMDEVDKLPDGEAPAVDPAAAPPLSPAAPAWRGKTPIEGVKNAPLAFVTFSSGGYSDMLLNWVRSVERLGVPFLVAGEKIKPRASQHLVKI